jgi:hypothetical protein
VITMRYDSDTETTPVPRPRIVAGSEMAVIGGREKEESLWS